MAAASGATCNLPGLGFGSICSEKLCFPFVKPHFSKTAAGAASVSYILFKYVACLKGACTSYCTCYFHRRLRRSCPTRPAAVLAQRGGSTSPVASSGRGSGGLRFNARKLENIKKTTQNFKAGKLENVKKKMNKHATKIYQKVRPEPPRGLQKCHFLHLCDPLGPQGDPSQEKL